MAEIVVREAVTEGDIAAVRLLMQAYGNYLAASPHGAADICLQSYEQELEELPGQYAVLLLATVGGAAAGCVALRRLPAEKMVCEMKRLWVDGAFRGLGLGRRLAMEAIVWAKGRGLETMYLDTVPAAMPEANALYAALGFERVERYNDNPVPDLVFYRLRLRDGSGDSAAR